MSFIFLLEIVHIWFQKIENFMLIQTKQTCLCDKMPPPPEKKVKIKKPFSNLAKSHFFIFYFYFFRGPFVTKTSLLF